MRPAEVVALAALDGYFAKRAAGLARLGDPTAYVRTAAEHAKAALVV